MAIVSLRIPQIGEGLQEARLVATLKKPGEKVRRDEHLYQMETDKAVMDVESPYEGILVEWLATEDEILPIGAEIARMEVEGEVTEAPSHQHGPQSTLPNEKAEPEKPQTPSGAIRNNQIPPRSRAYAKEKGVSDADLETIANQKGKVMPADIDEFLATTVSSTSRPYKDHPVSSKQRVLNSRLVRGSQIVVPGTMSIVAKWDQVEAARAALMSSDSHFRPSTFTMFAYAVVQAMKEHPTVRTTLVGEETFRTFEHVSLGIAVALPGDELVIAVVDDADTMTWHEFAQKTREQIELARTGQDQAHEAMTLSITNLQAAGVRDGVPVVVPPACATLFLGEAYNDVDPKSEVLKLCRSVNIAMTLDHRIMNGAGAAHFMGRIREIVENIQSILVD